MTISLILILSMLLHRCAHQQILGLIIDSLLVDWKRTVLSFFSSRLIRAANMSKWSNQISRIRVTVKNLRNKSKLFFFNTLLFLRASVSSRLIKDLWSDKLIGKIFC